MKSFDLDNTLYEACKKFGFSSDIRETFVSLKQNTLVVNTINNKINEFQNTQNNLLYDLLLYTYRKEKKFFFPAFKYAVNDIIFDKNTPRLCLTLHSNFSPLMSELVKKKCHFAMVSDYPNVIKRVAFNSGVRSGNIKLISGNESCLLNSKKFLKRNYLVNSTIDFRTSIPGMYTFLSDSMLKLALSLRPTTSIGVNFVNDFGELTFITKELNLDNSLEEIKQDLIKFIVTHIENSKYEFSKFNYLLNNSNLVKVYRSKLSAT